MIRACGKEIFPLIYHNHQEVGVALRRCEMDLGTPCFVSPFSIIINTAVFSLEASPHLSLSCQDEEAEFWPEDDLH